MKKITNTLGRCLLLITFSLSAMSSDNAEGAYPPPFITSLKQIPDDFTCAQSTGIVAFDIDETLLEAEDLTFQEPFCNLPVIKSFYKHVKKQEDPATYLTKTLVEHQKRKLIEPCVADIIRDLQNRHVPVIALSAFGAGSYGSIKSRKEFRSQELLQNGIDLSKDFAVQELDLEDALQNIPLDKRPQPGSIVFYKGIVTSARIPKGIVLKAFLSKMKMHPSHVLFIDDSLPNIFSVYKEMTAMDIPFTGHYYRATTEGRQHATIDMAVAETQINYMIEYGEYVSYNDAKVALSRPDSAPQAQTAFLPASLQQGLSELTVQTERPSAPQPNYDEAQQQIDARFETALAQIDAITHKRQQQPLM